jgi:RNA polymerase sigma factor (sigma-70 family)
LAFLKNITPPADDDATLIAAYRSSGDINILAEVYQRYMDLAYGVCFKYLKEQEAAKDAVMDVFEELIAKLLKHDVSNFRSWLFTVVRNHCLMKLRSNKQKTVAPDDDHMQFSQEMHPEDSGETEWQFDQLTKCIETLSPDQRTNIELFYLKEKCYKEIASVTGMEWNKVRSLIQNGRRNLKICMDRAANTKESSLDFMNLANKAIRNE